MTQYPVRYGGYDTVPVKGMEVMTQYPVRYGGYDTVPSKVWRL